MRVWLTISLIALVSPVYGFAAEENSHSVTHFPRKRILAISREIDRQVNAQLARENRETRPQADDETFVRRIHLEIVGRIPTLEETRGFLDAKDREKRAILIDRLLDSDGYVSRHFNFWADILRVKSRLPNGTTGRPYVDFITNSLADNKPYDVFVRELLTAEGPALARGNGATGYFLRDRGMPEEIMANTVRVFLGTRLECAQCHDHPFAKWTQRDFFEMVAFTTGLTTEAKPYREMGAKLRSVDAASDVKALASKMLLEMSIAVGGGGRGVARLPDPYQDESGSPTKFVKARTLFDNRELIWGGDQGGTSPNTHAGGSRYAFAAWLTSPENPRFTKVIANRLWGKAMGRGLIEPIDDITDQTSPSNPQLLDFLTRTMIDLDYDMKQFSRAIYNSRTYQSVSSDPAPSTVVADSTFAGPVLRRMSAEQLWDSLITLAVPDPDHRGNPRDEASRGIFGGDLYDGFEQVRDMSLDEILEYARREADTRRRMRDPEFARAQNREIRMPGERTVDEVNRLRRRVAELKLKAALNPRDPQRASWTREIRELTQRLNHIPSEVNPELVRASELPQPASRFHFLHQFGQSDRELIENANHDPAVTQVLTLMNGQIETWILSDPQTVLMYNTSTSSDPLEVVYLSMLSRRPTPQERSICLELGDRVPDEAVEDLIWTLANTTEFLFIR